MADMGKVIKEWESVLSRDPLDAPWDLIDETLTLLKEHEEKMEHLNNITLEYEKEVFRLQTLLKEREAVEPVKKDMVEITARYEYDCPCGAPLLIGQPYCADCGRPVKWV